jgi:hypothetical protein
MRVPVLVLALLAMPIAAGVAQSRGKGKDQRVRAADAQSECKDQQAATLARANADGHDPYGLDKKCGDPAPVPPPPPAPVPPPPSPVPPPSSYPTGIHEARGVVYEDVDGSGSRDMFSGEMGLAGWTVQLYWDGQLVGTATSDADGMYLFPGLGNSDKPWWICVIPQAGYVRTQPVSGDACSGNGMVHFLSSPFMTRLQTDFGEMIQ